MERDALIKKAINALTALGGTLSVLALAFAYEYRLAGGEPEYHQIAWILLGAATVVDAIDGSLVRAFDLQGTATRYDGARLDEYADLFTFVVGPVGVAWALDVLPFDSWAGLITGGIIIAVSCLQFSRTDNKTDYAFWGWPSYWNIYFFYMWGGQFSETFVITGGLFLSALVFAPIPFVYPSKFPVLIKTSFVGGFIWLGVMIAYVMVPTLGDLWLWISFIYPIYYFGLSFAMYPRLKEEADEADEDDGATEETESAQ